MLLYRWEVNERGTRGHLPAIVSDIETHAAKEDGKEVIHSCEILCRRGNRTAIEKS